MDLLGLLYQQSMNTLRRALGGAGIQTAALAFGGFSTAAAAASESYNGSAWTTQQV
jgi:hypothetical protein